MKLRVMELLIRKIRRRVHDKVHDVCIKMWVIFIYHFELHKGPQEKKVYTHERKGIFGSHKNRKERDIW